ncbi:uncharacterized protein N7483_008048 [Penicillium malachiteum]|uniref:uncharacterized protein n=1 Tax=Penicillium malachiteum TaxID=1324776 RepID=UPI0025479ACC|nr:uncharacterized protein N7483_008048 [Penicillium malachiteum]KAJ5726691.1 hypothetical protein N7483_008048 [Penicillium malachiteum]
MPDHLNYPDQDVNSQIRSQPTERNRGVIARMQIFPDITRVPGCKEHWIFTRSSEKCGKLWV